MESTTLVACNKRYIVSAHEDRISTRRTNEALTLLKPDYLGHKGRITHLAIHQPDHLFGTQDDWGRVVASSDDTNRVKVWLCDGDEEELMFARNMAEYVGYEKVTALAWTGDSKVAIGDVAGNFIVFNARYATSRYNRTVPKRITAIAPSQTDPHIHAVGYEDGSILLIRTNPTFQILFTNENTHTSPIAALAWRPEFSAPRTYTEKDGKVHKSSAEDMALLASCPSTKGEFRIWSWSAKADKLSRFREEEKDVTDKVGTSQANAALHWSRNGKVVQYTEGEVRIWDVRKLQIQSELFIPSTEEVVGIAVDGYRGIIYTLTAGGIEKHVIPAKPTASQIPTPLPPMQTPAGTPPPQDPPPPSTPETIRVPTPEPKVVEPSPERERTPPGPSIDSMTRVRQMAKQFDEDPGLARKKNNFIATAKAKHTMDRRKRAVSNDNDLVPLRAKSPEPVMSISQRSASSTSQLSKQPSLFDIAGVRVAAPEPIRERTPSPKPVLATLPTIENDVPKKDPPATEPKKETTPEKGSENEILDIPPVADTPKEIRKEDPPIPPPQPSPLFKPPENTLRQPTSEPLVITIPESNPTSHVPKDSLLTSTNPNHTRASLSIDRLYKDIEYLESPILGEALLTETIPVVEPVPKLPGSYLDDVEIPLVSISSGLLDTIPEETPALNIHKIRDIAQSPTQTKYAATEERDSDMKADIVNLVKLVDKPIPPKDAVQEPVRADSSTSSSSSSSKLVEPTSSYEDLEGISMDDQDDNHDAKSDTSVESVELTKLASTSNQLVSMPNLPTPQTPAPPTLETPTSSPATIKSSPSRASRIWAEKNGKHIHTQIVDYLSDGEETTPSPMYKPALSEQPPTLDVKLGSDEDILSDNVDSPAPFKSTLKNYDLFHGLTRDMVRRSKEQLETVVSTRLTQQNVCKAFFGCNDVKDIVESELKYAKERNIGLTELILKLWLGLDIDDEVLLKTILFGKNNGLSDALILSLAPLAGMEVWESLMLWCAESSGSMRSDMPHQDVVKGNHLVRIHLYAGFLCYNGSWRDAMEVYRKAKIYREAILMALFGMMHYREENIGLVDTMKDLFRNWGDQIASQDGDGLLVSMCFAASMMTYDPRVRPRKQQSVPVLRSPSLSPENGIQSPRRGSDAKISSPSAQIPVIRTQKPSPTESQLKPGIDSPRGRNWGELAAFMRTQKEKGYAEIRQPKTVQFKDVDSPPRGTSPSLAVPPRQSRTRSNSPLGRPIPQRRGTDDEEWSRRRRMAPREHVLQGSEKIIIQSANRRPSVPNLAERAKSPSNDPVPGRKGQEVMHSPLPFGARGSSIKPSPGVDPPPVPIKDEKRRLEDKERRRHKVEDERRHIDDPYRIGFGIQSHGFRERVV